MNAYLDQKIVQHGKMTTEIESTLNNLRDAIGISRKDLLSENLDQEIEIDIDERGNLVDHGENT